MTECWSPGDLRAAIDRELPAETLDRIAAHLEECGECRAVHAELEARARRVGLMMEDLAVVGRVAVPVGVTGHKRRWPVPLMPLAAAFALAAGLAIGWLVVPKKPVEVPAQRVATVPPEPLQTPPEPAPQLAQTPTRPAPARPRPRRVKPALAARPQNVDFVALDDRPIDNGVVMRVSWGPENLQADIIFGPDGSARAYRLVNANYRQ